MLGSRTVRALYYMWILQPSFSQEKGAVNLGIGHQILTPVLPAELEYLVHTQKKKGAIEQKKCLFAARI